MTESVQVPVITFDAKFAFKPWAEGKDGYARLQELLAAGKISQEDIAVIPAAEEGGQVKYQRKPREYKLEVPNMAAIIPEGLLAAKQVDHIQQLVNKAVKDNNSKLVDAGNVEIEGLDSWATILERPFAQRQAAIKVTAEMLKAAKEAIVEVLGNLGAKPQAIATIENLVDKKFSAAACTKIQSHLDKIQGMLFTVIENMAEDVAVQHEAALELLTGNLEKALAPAEELEEDAFDLG